MTYLLTLLIPSALQSLLAGPFVLPEENLGRWAPGIQVGVDGGVEQYLAGGQKDRALTGRVIDLTKPPYNADNSGVTCVRDKLVAALAEAAEGDVIHFPDGIYRFERGYVYSSYKDTVTIRGAGPARTTLHCATTDPIFLFNDPGSFSSNQQVVSGSKSKGTAALRVDDSSVYALGAIVEVSYENETDNNRIQNGAAPVWSSGGYPRSRTLTAIIKAIPDSTHVTIDPPLPADADHLALSLSALHPVLMASRTEGVGFEDFSVTFDSTRHPTQFIAMNDAIGCWVHNVEFANFSRRSSNGSCLRLIGSYKCQVSHCTFNALPGSSSDGAIETAACSSILIVDNIIVGSFGSGIYDSGNTCNSVIAYNYRDEGCLSIFHNAHPSLNLLEGNVAPLHQSDGYHGSSSHNTIYRNWFWEFGAILNRFKRNYVIAGNLVGEDGARDAVYSFGNPNMGNGFADGFAGPTGTSDRAGERDYLQPGFGANEYVIKESDIAVGDFWEDWEITGILATRTSDAEGVFTVSGGRWHVGPVATAGSRLYPTAHWNDKSNRMTGGEVLGVEGVNVTIRWPGGVLPPAGTAVEIYMGAAGWQERDLDVEASSTLVSNYEAKANGLGAVVDPTPDTLPDSLAYDVRPEWWKEGDFAGLWPPIDPNRPVFARTMIPAGYRYAVRVAAGDLEDGVRPPSAPKLDPAKQ